MKRISLFKSLILGVMVFTLTSCDKETILNPNEVPIEISAYVTTHFPNNKIMHTTEDIDGMAKTYDVILKGNITLKFNRKKEIISIEAHTELPESVIPEKI